MHLLTYLLQQPSAMKGAEARNHLLRGTSSRCIQACIRTSRFPWRSSARSTAGGIGALKRRKTRLVALSCDEIRRKTRKERETEQAKKETWKRPDNAAAIKPKRAKPCARFVSSRLATNDGILYARKRSRRYVSRATRKR